MKFVRIVNGCTILDKTENDDIKKELETNQ